MKGMRQYLICAEIVSSGNFLYDIVHESSMRGAWRSFKNRFNGTYNRLRFKSASTAKRSFSKVN